MQKTFSESKPIYLPKGKIMVTNNKTDQRESRDEAWSIRKLS